MQTTRYLIVGGGLTGTLEAEGIAKFSDAFSKLLAQLGAKEHELMFEVRDRQ